MMKRSSWLIVAVALASCRSIPAGSFSALQETQHEAAIINAETAVIADSATQDAEKLLAVVRAGGDDDLVYIAEKHLAEVNAIKSRAVKERDAQESAVAAAKDASDDVALIERQNQEKDEKITELSYQRTILVLVLTVIIALFLLIFFVKTRTWFRRS